MTTNRVLYRDILLYLKTEYKNRGSCNFFFSAKKLDMKYSNHQKGRILAKMCEKGVLEKWNAKKSPAVWKTRF